MDEFKIMFMNYFNEFNRDGCVTAAIRGLDDGLLDIPTLYEDVLKPALNSIGSGCEEEGCIWKEHVKTSIVRTVVESLYPRVIRFKENVGALNIKVVLLCPEKEYHEVGLRMVSDFFELNGYESYFVGTNTPRDQVYHAISEIKPKYVAISVTDYYLLFEAQKMIRCIKDMTGGVTVLAGGNAFRQNIHSISSIGADLYLETYDDIVKLRAGEAK